MTSALTSIRVGGYPSGFLAHAPRERDDEHLGRRLAQDVVDGRREEPRLASPARGRAEDDEVRPALLRRLDDRFADRAGADGAHLDLNAEIVSKRDGFGEGRCRALVLVEELGV